MITLFPQVGLFIGMSEWITAIGTTLTATSLIAIVGLLWQTRDKVTAMDGKMTLVDQKIEASAKESNLRFMMMDQKFAMVDQKFAELTKQVEHQAAMLEQQRTWRWENGAPQETKEDYYGS